KLLFCDYCDHGFHLYCLKPPLKEAPENEEWACRLCQRDFKAGRPSTSRS
ncbi:Dpf2 protein, partial [Aphelenchoides avenae]